VPRQAASEYLDSGRVRHFGFNGNRLRFAASTLSKQRHAAKVIFGHINLSPLALLMGRCEKHLIVHGIEVWRRLSDAQRLGVSRVSRILAVSDFTAQQLAQHNGVPPCEIVRFPNTLDPYFPRSMSSLQPGQLSLPPGPFLLSVTRLAESETYKGIDFAIKAMPQIIRAVPNAYYVVVGQGWDRRRLENLANSLGVGDHVRFVGSVPDEQLAIYYRECELFLLPSRKEGFGIVFLEAMHYGKPCIGAAAGGIPEVVDHERTGLLVPFGDADAIATSAIRLLSDKQERERMGRCGKQRLENEFLFPAFRRRLEVILSS